MYPVQGITIHCEMRLVLNHLWVSESAINYIAVHWYSSLITRPSSMLIRRSAHSITR
jgi:hypothetical protein